MHLGTSAYASHIGGDVRIGFEIDFDKVGPVHNRKRVRIGDREVTAQQVLTIRQLIIQIGESLRDRGLRRRLGIVRRRRVEQR